VQFEDASKLEAQFEVASILQAGGQINRQSAAHVEALDNLMREKKKASQKRRKDKKKAGSQQSYLKKQLKAMDKEGQGGEKRQLLEEQLKVASKEVKDIKKQKKLNTALFKKKRAEKRREERMTNHSAIPSHPNVPSQYQTQKFGRPEESKQNQRFQDHKNWPGPAGQLAHSSHHDSGKFENTMMPSWSMSSDQERPRDQERHGQREGLGFHEWLKNRKF